MPTPITDPPPAAVPTTGGQPEAPVTPAAPAKTADDAPAPVHPTLEREVLVRDAYGRDPYGGDRYDADGERDDVELGLAPEQLPDPIAGALRKAKAAADPPEPGPA